MYLILREKLFCEFKMRALQNVKVHDFLQDQLMLILIWCMLANDTIVLLKILD